MLRHQYQQRAAAKATPTAAQLLLLDDQDKQKRSQENEIIEQEMKVQEVNIQPDGQEQIVGYEAEQSDSKKKPEEKMSSSCSNANSATDHPNSDATARQGYDIRDTDENSSVDVSGVSQHVNEENSQLLAAKKSEMENTPVCSDEIDQSDSG